ncbi:hypothetical protein I79_019018, partial [Cricetulus griseus]
FFAVMLFLITLLLPDMLTKGRILTQTQKESFVSGDHKTNVKAALDKIDCQDEGNIVLTQTQKESMVSDDHKTHVKTAWDKIDCPCELSIKDTLQRNFCASHQYQTAFEDLTNDNQHLSALLISLRKCCDYEYQVDQVNFSNMATGSKGPELGNNKKYISFYPLEECLNLAITVLLFH